MSQYVLGLDLGPNSIGWAMLAVDPESGDACGFFDTEAAGHPPMGVRVFEAGLDNFDTSKEEPRNQARRDARSMRRNHARRNARRRQMRQLLTASGLLPSSEADLDEIFRTDPYELRARALAEPLAPHELGRVLLHLCQRRGFKSNRKSGQAKEDKGILEEIGALDKSISENGFRTLGEYLNSLNSGRRESEFARLRARHTRRDMYELEFDAIVSVQRGAHELILTDDLVEELRRLVFFQHPFEITEERRQQAPSRANLHRAPSVRNCPLEPTEKCAHRGEWFAQQFRVLKEVANLRISEHRGPERDLKPEEKQVVLDELFSKERVKFDALRKCLAKIGVDPDATFNLERGSRTTLLGNSVENALASKFGRKTWGNVDDASKVRLRDLLVHSEDEDLLRAELLAAGAPEEKVEKLIKWVPADGYMGYSLRALRRILPFLEAGKNEYEAVQAAYPDRPAAGMVDRLPPLASPDIPAELDNLTNPIVRRALVEVRKVVNALVREHGKPLRIVVEMARNMKDGPQRRKENSKRNRDRQAEREVAAKHVAEFGGNPNSRQDINRWLFWKEQGERCIYTGRSIPVSELFHGGEWEVDHILPRWRSLDDSLMNKVLVHRIANEQKGDRTPCEWLGEESEEYKQLLRRADAELKGHRLPYPKFKKLAQRELGVDDFAARQLNDTRYITTLVVSYLSLLYPAEMRVGEKTIQTCRGGLTSELRRTWELNNLLSPLYNADGNPVLSAKLDRDGNPLKSRDDHRHHAIDAVVVALSTRANLKRYQDYWKVRDLKPEVRSPIFLVPWEGFRADVQENASRIVVSHRVQRKVAGALHEETFYGPAKDREGELVADRYVTRKVLADLTGKMVNNIRDDEIRCVVTARLYEHGWDGKSNALPKDWSSKPLTMASGVPIRKVRVEVPITNAVRLKHRYAVLGNNHHMEVVAATATDEGGQPKKMWATVVSTMEAARRVRQEKAAVVQRDHGSDKTFVMSLARKESVWATSPVTGERVVCVVQKMSGASQLSSGFDIYFRDCRDSRVAGEGNKTPFKRMKSFRPWADMDIEKIQVDPLGRVRPAND